MYRGGWGILTKFDDNHEPSEDAPNYIDLTELENNIKYKLNNIDLTKIGNIHESSKKGAPDYIDLTEFDDNLTIQNSIKHKVFQLVKKLDVEKYKIILKIIELKENDKLKMIERIMKMNEAKKFKIIKEEEAKK
ncbi:hypothetical protein RirG_034340 [Rhizophagus irregularis DAOM 197198w]|uniref:Uncharacterized protein n=1 Tax=Rhizophagus irregularis (strain DAOM 197198w) TaxID=1432141 RepID=A0A015L9D1_RHIIW|nr:hypothetical protein RirG_034340 [Rhizophagus irregularis DAOM 197198w]